MHAHSRNFGFLAEHNPLLARLGALAERYFTADPETCLPIPSASAISVTDVYTPSSSIRCHRHARARAFGSVPSGCGFDLGVSSLPSGATMRLRPPRRWKRVESRGRQSQNRAFMDGRELDWLSITPMYHPYGWRWDGIR